MQRVGVVEEAVSLKAVRQILVTAAHFPDPSIKGGMEV
jgi:hypothetical protein